MALTVLGFSRIRDLASNLGWKDNNGYTIGSDCLSSLESIEDELLNEDVINRSVHISFYACETVKKDLLPILLYCKDNKILAAVVRILVNLSLPVCSLLPVEDAIITKRTQKVKKQLTLALVEIKNCFLNDAATFPLVSMLREAMIKSEKHAVPLKEDDCRHLKNCLLLIRNILHLPELNSQNGSLHQDNQNKLIWNLFVQGLDGAMLLMLNSKYRIHWTDPLTAIIALLYRNQSIVKIHEVLENVSSASETSCDDEESDGSKNSSVSLSSEPCKVNSSLSDSGCHVPSDTSANCFSDQKFEEKPDVSGFDIHTKLGKIQISDESDNQHIKSLCRKNPFSQTYELDSGSSSCSEPPHHKKIKGNVSDDYMSMGNITDNSKNDSGLSENMEDNSPSPQRKSPNDICEKKMIQNLKAVQKLRSLQMNNKVSESDSSNEDFQKVQVKYRSHPPTGRRGKSPRRINGCMASVCLSSAIIESAAKGRIKYPLWEKRSSVTTLVDADSKAPSDEDIGNLIKDFTLSFLHGGLSNLVKDMMNILLEGPNYAIDKSIFFWIISYFLHLATTVNITLDHISYILSSDVIGYLIYESVILCENIQLHSEANEKVEKYLADQLTLVVSTLKEIMVTIDMYSRKSNLPKDKAFFRDLCGKLVGFQHLRHLPLLLFNSSSGVSFKVCTENIVILNHFIILVLEKGMEQIPESKKINFFHHLKLFSTKNIINSYGTLLQNYKYNSATLNECIFTMLHHIAGDIRATDLLIEPNILKAFSSILKEDIELEPYQEDLIMYILNKFSYQIQKNQAEQQRDEKGEFSGSSGTSSSSSGSANSNCLLSEDDDLFWWYLQFEQDKDPIARISEHIPTSKRDILSKLQLKGIISSEQYEILETKMKAVEMSHEDIISCEDLVQMESFDDEITHLLRTLVQSGWRQHLTWVQDTLLETCYVKLGLSDNLPEAVPLYFLRRMMSVPLVPYTEEQRLILKDDMFLQLLKKIGFHVGAELCPMYPRIPLVWTADMLFTIASRLGPVRKDNLKFSYEELLLANPLNDPVAARLSCHPPTLPPMPPCGTQSCWLTAVQESKIMENNFLENFTQNK